MEQITEEKENNVTQKRDHLQEDVTAGSLFLYHQDVAAIFFFFFILGHICLFSLSLDKTSFLTPVCAKQVVNIS